MKLSAASPARWRTTATAAARQRGIDGIRTDFARFCLCFILTSGSVYQIRYSPLQFDGLRPVARPGYRLSPEGSTATMTSSTPRLAAQIEAATGVNPATCYQCGKCSAGCPMASESDLRPHQVMRRVMYGPREQMLRDESIWLCITCETCSARCPNECDPAGVIDALREIANNEGLAVKPRAIDAFHKTFLEQVRANGRLYEMGLVVGYKLRSRAFMSDVDSAPGMFSRGKMSLMPDRIKGVGEVKRIFDKCGVEL
jgi:heterodisulfide reductase subunit C2